MSFINNGLINVTTSPSGSDYGEKGIEQGDDFGVPGHSTPSPTASMDSFNPMVGRGGGSSPASGQSGKSVTDSMDSFTTKVRGS